jgi:hypothetical protein
LTAKNRIVKIYFIVLNFLKFLWKSLPVLFIIAFNPFLNKDNSISNTLLIVSLYGKQPIQPKCRKSLSAAFFGLKYIQHPKKECLNFNFLLD